MYYVQKIYINSIIPAGNLQIEMILTPYILPPDEGIDLNAELLNMSELKIGNDDDSDLIMMPGEINIEFCLLDKPLKDVIDLFNYIAYRNRWSIHTYIRINGNLIWKGYVDKDLDKMKLNYMEKSIRLNLIDEYSRIKDLDPKLNPFNYNLDDTKLITEIIYDIFTHYFYDPYVNNLICLSNLEGQILINYTEYITFPFNQFRAALSFYYGQNSNYATINDVLKSILVNYNLIVYVGQNRTLYLIPRFIEFNYINVITHNQIISISDYKMIQRIKGMQVNVWKGGYPKDNNYYIYQLGNYVDGDRLCEKLYIDQPAGTYPGGGYSGIAVIYNSTIYWIEFDRIRYKKLDGSYSDYKALYKIVADDVWEKIKSERIGVEIEVKGLNWEPGFYMIPGSDIVFRATRFKYNFIKNTTKISLRQVGIIPFTSRLLEDGTLRLTTDYSKRLLEGYEIGAYQEPIQQSYRLTEDSFKRLLEDNNYRLN
ncbi:hypothetical protein [Rosettibacter firmus]|uniref:hypothetical protein n=1 Tax=Rosettibacter firmus TaxID=3111522 RepID=UPI00336C308B